MCNDFGNHIPYDDYLRAFSQTRIPIRWPSAAPNLEPRDDIWPTDAAPVIRQTDDGHEFIQLRWGFPPTKAKGPANYQFPFRETSLSGRPMSGAGVSLLRVYGRKIAEDQMEIHESRRGLVLLCGLVATDARRRRRVHATDNRTRS